MAALKAPPIPCGSCPYRTDVPSGIWHPDEYAKLVEYDNETHAQPFAVFMCHQRDGNLCGGWLACHDKDNLLALRIARVDPSVFDYVSPVPVFKSGREAAEHGMRDVSGPSPKAEKMISGLIRKRRIITA